MVAGRAPDQKRWLTNRCTGQAREGHHLSRWRYRAIPTIITRGEPALAGELCVSGTTFSHIAQPLLPGAGYLAHLRVMSEPRNIKRDARQLVEDLPESATWDDLAYEVYVRASIEAGIADADAGRTMSHEEAVASIRSRIRRAS